MTKTQRDSAPLTASAVASEGTNTIEPEKCKSPVGIQTCAGQGIQQPVYLKDYVKLIKDSTYKRGMLHYCLMYTPFALPLMYAT